MNTPARISALLLVADKAIELHGFECDVREDKRTLDEAYRVHKEKNGLLHGLGHYERDTPEWDAMMAATAAEYQEVERAKSGARNAKRRLDTAIKVYLRGGNK